MSLGKVAIVVALVALAIVVVLLMRRSDDCREMDLERARNMANGASYPYTERDPWTCR